MRAVEFANGARHVNMEDINVKNLMRRGHGSRKRGFNRKFHTADTYNTRLAIEGRCNKYEKHPTKTNPRYTSQECVKCEHIAKENRHHDDFKCIACTHADNADGNACINISLVTLPEPAKSRVRRSSEEFVALFVRRELDSAGRRFMPCPSPQHLGDATPKQRRVLTFLVKNVTKASITSRGS